MTINSSPAIEAQRAFCQQERLARVDAVEDDVRFTPCLELHPTWHNVDFHGMTGNGDWSSLRVIDKGRTSAANQARFARTLTAPA